MSPLLRILVAIVALLLSALLSVTAGAQDWERVAPSAAAAEGVRLYDAGDYAGARARLDAAARANPRDVSVVFWQGRVAEEQNRMDEAARLFERAEELDPKNAVIPLWTGRVYGQQAQKANIIRQAGLARKTKSAWERALALDSENLEVRASLIEYYLQAPGIMGGSKEKALAQAEEIRKRNFLRGSLALGNVYEQDKKFAEAERVFIELRQKEPVAGTARLAQFYQLQQQHEKAFELLDASLKSHPKEASLLYAMGRLGAVSGKHLDRAEQALIAYLALPAAKDLPPHAAAHWRLGNVLEAKKDLPRARDEYQAALKLDPQHKEATAALKRLG